MSLDSSGYGWVVGIKGSSWNLPAVIVEEIAVIDCAAVGRPRPMHLLTKKFYASLLVMVLQSCAKIALMKKSQKKTGPQFMRMDRLLYQR